MGGCFSANLPANSVWTGYFIVICLVCAGLQASTNHMFMLLRVATCTAGSSETYPAPPGIPYCNRDALRSTDSALQWFGYTSTSYGDYTVNLGRGSETVAEFCIPEKNSTCALQSAMAYSSGSPQLTVTAINIYTPSGSLCADPSAAGCAAVFEVNADDLGKFARSMSGYLGLPSLSSFNNIPVKFFAQSLPTGLSSSETYFLRAVGSKGFSLSKSKTEPPLTSIPKPSTMPSDLVMAFPAFNTCPFQSKMFQDSALNTNADGSVKNSACGYCLSQGQQAMMSTVPGAAGAALALLSIVLVASRFECLCKMRFFKGFAVLFSVLSWIFLLVAVIVGFYAAYSVASCSFLMGDPSTTYDVKSIVDTFEAVPNGLPKVGGFQPVSAKSVPVSGATKKYGASFSCMQGGLVACYNKPYFAPFGAIYFITAIVFLFLFLIFIAIRVDFSLTHAATGGAVTVNAYEIKPMGEGKALYV